MSRQWHYMKDGERHGPLSADALKSLAKAGVITPTTPVWTEGLASWKEARLIKGLIPSPPPFVSTAPATDPVAVTSSASTSAPEGESSFRSQMAQGGKYIGVLGVFAGLAGDVLQPLAPINGYLFGLIMLLTAVFGIQWLRLPPADRRHWEKRIPQQALICCLALLLAFGFWSVGELLAGSEDRGLLASQIGPLRTLQDQMFRLSKDVKDIKEDTSAIKGDTTAILDQTKSISKSVEGIGQLGGRIKNPTTAADYYHNAKIEELGGDFAAASASYERYVTFNQEFVDALLSYLQMLRTQRGGEEALRSIGKLRKVAPGNPAIEFVELRLASGDVRRSRLEAFVARHPDFAPAILDLADFYSAEEMPDRSGVDVDKEQEWLQRFVDVAEQGGFIRYYVDKTQAEKLLAAARQRLVKAGGDVAMEADEKVFLANRNEVWVMDNNATKIEFSFDGKDWRPITGLVTTIMLARGTIDDPRVLDRAATVYVRYTDKRGAVSQVYRLPVASVDTKSAAPELGQPLEAPSGLP